MAVTKLVREGDVPRIPSVVPMAMDITVWNDVIGGSILTVRGEIDDAFQDMADFHNKEPDECMRLASGHSARLSFIRVKILRVEDWDREWKNIRVREIEPAIDELREQWKNASRLHSVRELDWKMESGER